MNTKIRSWLGAALLCSAFWLAFALLVGAL